MKYLKSPPGKRIDGLAADTSATEAASKVLRIRLRAVEQMLPLALERAGDSPEFVHQLRVSTRRADAALRTLGACLKGNVRKNTRSRLGRIRRSATTARECDVHIEHFRGRRDEAEGDVRATFDALIHWSGGQRYEAQRAIEDAAARYPVEELRASRQRLLDSVREPRRIPSAGSGPVTLADVAGVTLPPLIGGMRDAAAADLHVLENLHELRIRGKRLRYALEIFGACYESGLKAEYEQVTALQQELGTINDLHEIIRRVEAFAEHAEPADARAIDTILDDERDRLAKARFQAVKDSERGAWTAALDALEKAIGDAGVSEQREIAS